MEIIRQAQACTICAEYLPQGPRPVFTVHPKAKILIIGQAPGRKVHETGIPWDDASGKRLRHWLGVEEATFYNPEVFALLPHPSPRNRIWERKNPWFGEEVLPYLKRVVGEALG